MAETNTWADAIELEEQQNGPMDEFPPLGADPPKLKDKKKKSKPQAINLRDFLGGGPPAPSRGPSSGKEILLHLPTGSRGKEEGDEQQGAGLGGAFGNYAGGRGDAGFRRDDREERRGRDMEPSRADMVDDWGATRKFQPSDNRGSSFGGFRDREDSDRPRREPREPLGPSNADLVDDWGREKKFVPSAPAPSRGGFGDGERRGGFRDGPAPRRFDDGPSRADEGDWSRRAPEPAGASGRPAKSFGYAGTSRPEEEEDRWTRKAAVEPAPTQAATAAEVPKERPRLNLAPRTKPIEQPPPAPQAEAEQAAAGDDEPKEQVVPKPKSNPFGAARPREEVLREKGIDPVKLEEGSKGQAAGASGDGAAAADADATAVAPRDESEEEAALKANIQSLQLKLEALREVEGEETEDQRELQETISAKQQELEQLAAELNEKARLGGKQDEPAAAEQQQEQPQLAAEQEQQEQQEEDEEGFETVTAHKKKAAAAAAAAAAAPAAAAAKPARAASGERGARDGGRGSRGGRSGERGGERPDGERSGRPGFGFGGRDRGGSRDKGDEPKPAPRGGDRW